MRFVIGTAENGREGGFYSRGEVVNERQSNQVQMSSLSEFPGIESLPDVCGGEACVVRTRIPVWLLENARRRGVSEQLLLAAYHSLRAEDMVNSWNYARSHATEIDRQIRENEAA
jgi:uncharacterized protein (DUF433 family)